MNEPLNEELEILRKDSARLDKSNLLLTQVCFNYMTMVSVLVRLKDNLPVSELEAKLVSDSESTSFQLADTSIVISTASPKNAELLIKSGKVSGLVAQLYYGLSGGSDMSGLESYLSTTTKEQLIEDIVGVKDIREHTNGKI